MRRLVLVLVALQLGVSAGALFLRARPVETASAVMPPTTVVPVPTTVPTPPVTAPPPKPTPPTTVPPRAVARPAPRPMKKPLSITIVRRLSPGDVFVVGDSLTVGADPWLAGAVSAQGWQLAGVDARVGRPVDEGLSILRADADQLPRTVVVALGTNDLWATPADVDRWVATARAIVGDRRLVWVNLRCDPSRSPSLERYHRINDALAAATARYGVGLADWEAWSTARGIEPGYDGVHYDNEAYRWRAAFYAGVAAGTVAD
jgi:hypothetical protein